MHMVCLDVANGYSEFFVDRVRKVRERHAQATIFAGNVVTGEMVEELILTGADVRFLFLSRCACHHVGWSVWKHSVSYSLACIYTMCVHWMETLTFGFAAIVLSFFFLFAGDQDWHWSWFGVYDPPSNGGGVPTTVGRH